MRGLRHWFARFKRWLFEGRLHGCGICKSRRFPSFKYTRQNIREIQLKPLSKRIGKAYPDMFSGTKVTTTILKHVPLESDKE